MHREVTQRPEASLVGKHVITAPNSPSASVRVAMIVDDGCPIELMQLSNVD